MVAPEQPRMTVLLQRCSRARSHTAERQEDSQTARVASQMGARAEEYQAMGSQSMGWGNGRQAAEVSNAVPGAPQSAARIKEPATRS